ncbi:PH domain leucine-rich repeat-containing protein phosphatase 2 [Aphanomyces cochlioides]|nr:PH domain leucine-rich repeat-containing protein phosphatase 2 [Aphanomyces cochlioides]
MPLLDEARRLRRMGFQNNYGFPIWSLIYAIVFSFSFLAAVIATISLRRSTKSVSSCVVYSMLWFFIWKSIYSGSRIAMIAICINEYMKGNSSWLILDADHDIGGFRLLGYEKDPKNNDLQLPPVHARVALFAGDAALLSCCLWMLVLVMELLRLVKRTMDRGSVAEKRLWYIYLFSNVMIILAYFTILVIFSYHQGTSGTTKEKGAELSFFSDRFRVILISAATVQSLVIFVVGFAVFYLNRTGLNLESVECRVVKSPLYKRLKRILIVYVVCAVPFLTCSWVVVAHGYEYLKIIPDVVTELSTILYATSGLALAVILAASQQCVLSWCRVSEAVLLEIEANEAPLDFPAFVNTDIESSSALWGHLGNVMHDAQDIHDTLLRELLVPHHGYEITTAGDSFQLAFHNIADAVAYCLDVQEQLLLQPWPAAFVDSHMPGSATILAPRLNVLKRQKAIFHGLRVRMGIHASTPAEGELFHEVHPVTGRIMYAGLSELIGREVSDLGQGGQIIVTAPIVRWLRANMSKNTAWAKAHPIVMQELGVYRVADLKIDLGIAQVVPLSLAERIDMLPPLSRIQRTISYAPRLSNNYDLLISPKEHCV